MPWFGTAACTLSFLGTYWNQYRRFDSRVGWCVAKICNVKEPDRLVPNDLVRCTAHALRRP